MQVLKDNLFYHSNAQLGADGGFEDERQVLVEEQKSCRARSRKFSLETNRRRKALDERRKQWDVQEQRLRENILLQRRQRVQDATERFQRAHLPPSQRRRQCYRKTTPNIEDALNQIQGTLESYARQSSFLSGVGRGTDHTSTVDLEEVLIQNDLMSIFVKAKRWHIPKMSCAPSPKPPMVPKPSLHRRTLSAVEAYAKVFQERNVSMTSFKNCQPFLNEIQETQERERETCSAQEHPAHHLSHSESLSSLDSLENEEPNHCSTNRGYPRSSSLLESEKPPLDEIKPNNLCPSSDVTSSSTTMLLSDAFPRQREKRPVPEPTEQEESEDTDKRMHRPPPATQGFFPMEQTAQTEAQPPLGQCGLLTLCEALDAHTETHCEESSQGNCRHHKITAVANSDAAAGNAALELSRLWQEGQLDLRQQRAHDHNRHAEHPPAAEILLPAKSGNRKDSFSEAPSKPTIFMNDNTEESVSRDASIQQTARENDYSPSEYISGDAMNNLNKGPNSELKVEQSKNTDMPHQASVSNITSDIPRCPECPQEGKYELPFSAEISVSDSKMCEVRFIKGILKRQSKYASGDTTSRYSSRHLIFAKQVALSIRDSIELTRAKTKEGNKTVKKKLRWLDEVNGEEEDKELSTNLIKQNQVKSKSVCPAQSKSNLPPDHQLSLTAFSGASRAGPSVTPTASNGSHFTKQAWADVGVQGGKLQEQGDEVKVQRNSARTGGPKVPRRERSARAGAGPVSSRTRKGSVIRPQSATEASQIARTQGKMIVPRPPPRMEAVEGNPGDTKFYIAKTLYSVDHSSVSCKQALPLEQAVCKDTSDGFPSPHTQHIIRTDSGVIYTPLPPSYNYAFSEGTAKGTPSSGHQESHVSDGRRELAYDEKGLRLDCTPTDEEIFQLWHGVRCALATKDGDPRNFQTHNGSLSALPQARANLSHVTINGESLISGVKAATRLGSFSLSSSNARNLVRRQALESGGVRRRACVEPSRHAPGSGSSRRLLLSSQATVPVAPFPSNYDLAYPNEGLESAAQSQLAEIYSEGLLLERDTTAAMATAQTQKPGVVHQLSQQQGLTTVSLEEQKVLLSLERLNHQLHCVQEYAGGDTAVRGLIYVDTPTARGGEAAAQHKRRTLSADTRSRTQRRF